MKEENVVPLFEAWMGEKGVNINDSASSPEKLIVEFLESVQVVLKEKYVKKRPIASLFTANAKESGNFYVELVDSPLQERENVGSQSMIRVEMIEVQGASRRWKIMQSFVDRLYSYVDNEWFWIRVIGFLWLIALFAGLDQPFIFLLLMCFLVTAGIMACAGIDYRQWRVVITYHNFFLLFVMCVATGCFLKLAEVNSKLTVSVIIFAIWSILIITTLVELIDHSKIITMMFIPLMVTCSILTLRFYLLGYGFSTLQNDVVLHYEKAHFSFIAFGNYVLSAIFFLVISKIINLFYIRFADLPIYIPGAWPHLWKPRIGRLVYQEYKMDKYVTDPAKLRIVIAGNVFLACFMYLIFFLHDYLWKTKSYIP